MIKNLDKGTRMTLGVEGKWSDHPADPGGKTMLGVTLKTFWRARHRRIISPDTQLRNLTPQQATKIYKLMYWNAICGDQLPSGIDVLVFDIQVNSGQGGRRLQRALNYLFGSRLVVDNSIGSKTVRVLNNLVDSDAKNVYKILAAVASRRLIHWSSLRIWATFKRGWASRGAKVLIHVTRIADGTL